MGIPKVQELFEPGTYLDQQAPGFFSVLSKPNGRARQNSYELRFLPTVVKHANENIDTWITQAIFSARNRRAVNMSSVGLLFADLDTYHVGGLQKMDPEQQAQLLVYYCAQEGIPAPSLVLFSGRGLQAKWLLDESITRVSLYEWQEAENSLIKALEPFAADVAARDISRVLRLDHTVNTKSGLKCRIVHTTGDPNNVARYDFQELSEHLTALYEPLSVVQTPSVDKKIIKRRRSGWELQKLNWRRLYDLQNLWNRRGGVPEGYRELTLFWELNFLLKAEPVKASEMYAEAEALAKNIDPSPGWWHRSDLSTLYRKAKRMQGGEKIIYKGKEYPVLYNPRNQYLIELFEITPEEEKDLKTIVSYGEKCRRQTDRRRAQGVRPRAEYEEQSLSKKKPWDALGISRATWYKYYRNQPKMEIF